MEMLAKKGGIPQSAARLPFAARWRDTSFGQGRDSGNGRHKTHC